MARQLRPKNDRSKTRTATHAAKTPAVADSIEDLTKEQLERLADLIANGEVPIEEALAIDNQSMLIVEIARRRQSRLLKFIARSIALDIARSRESAPQENCNNA